MQSSSTPDTCTSRNRRSSSCEGKEEYYAYDDQQRERADRPSGQRDGRGSVASSGTRASADDKEQLGETTMNPEAHAAQGRHGDSVEADRIFQMLMGDESRPRRDFIEKNARFVVTSYLAL